MPSLKVFCFCVESPSMGEVYWYFSEAARDLALAKTEASPGDMVTVFDHEYAMGTTDAELTNEVDAAVWEQTYTPQLQYFVPYRNGTQPA